MLGRLVLEAKEDMGKRGMRSPDEWDAVVLTFAEPVGSRAKPAVNIGTGRRVVNLAQMGQNPLLRTISAIEETRFIEEIIRTAVSLANKKIGAIIVFERETELGDLIEMGTPLDAKVSKEILTSIFLPYSPIHDGAVIIKGGRIAAAGCFLPLTLSAAVSKTLGTRHRAAVGITEETDAVVIAVSEEAGTISVAVEGKLTRGVDAAALRRILTKIFITGRKEKGAFVKRLGRLFSLREKP